MTTSTAYLLDSHVLLWWWFDPQRLPKGVLALLSDAETLVVVSSASVWELEQLVLVTADSQLSAFTCRRLWEG